MLTIKRTVLASLLTPAAILLTPVVGSILVLHSGTASLVEPMDDAPMRAAGLVLFVLAPIAYPVLILLFLGFSWLLNPINVLSKRMLTVSVVLVSIVLGAYLGLQSPFGAKDQLVGVGLFSLLLAVCLGFGATVWWMIVTPGHNHSLQGTAREGGDD